MTLKFGKQALPFGNEIVGTVGTHDHNKASADTRELKLIGKSIDG